MQLKDMQPQSAVPSVRQWQSHVWILVGHMPNQCSIKCLYIKSMLCKYSNRTVKYSIEVVSWFKLCPTNSSSLVIPSVLGLETTRGIIIQVFQLFTTTALNILHMITLMIKSFVYYVVAIDYQNTKIEIHNSKILKHHYLKNCPLNSTLNLDNQ